MSLSQFLLTLRRGWPIILAGLLLGVVPGVLLAKMATPSYQATATAMISLPSAKTIAELQQGDTFTEARARTYASLAGSRLVQDKVATAMGLDKDKAVSVLVASEPQTSVITAVGTDADAKKASDAANLTIEKLVATVPEVDGSQNDLIKIVPMTPAIPPSGPASPQTFLYAAIGALLGLSLGFLAAYLWVMARARRRNGAAHAADGSRRATVDARD